MVKSKNNIHDSYNSTPNEQEVSLEEAAHYLDRVGVPKKLKWRTLLLYMRCISDYDYLNKEQKYQIQNLLLKVLKEKKFDEQVYRDVLKKKGEILFKPYKQELRQTYSEISNLLNKFQNVYTDRKGDIQDLQNTTIRTLQEEDNIENLMSTIRNSFQQVIQNMEKDIYELYQETQLDSLTNLYNRKVFHELLEQICLQASEQATNLSLAMLDIDYFKDINDEYGHRIGDQALATVGKIIREYADEICNKNKESFYAARYGGEEFTIILPECSLDEAYKIVEEIRKRVEKYSFVVRNSSGEIVSSGIKLTISGGVADFDSAVTEDPGNCLIEKADKAMYRAKQNGRNQVSF